MAESHSSKVAFIWSIAELLRGDYKRSDYGKVVLPFVVLRRLDCVLADTKQKVLEANAKLPKQLENREPALMAAAGQSFYNLSKLDFTKLLDDPEHLKENLESYIRGFSSAAQDVLERFAFQTQIERLASSDLLFLVVSRFAELDLHPSQVSNLEMGYMFEELIRRFSEQSNETAGEHFTPREVIRLMVNLLFIEDTELLTTPGRIVTMLDPAAGTGGMLSVAEDRLRELNGKATLKAFGQELNEESYAICKSDLMIKGQDPSNIQLGNSFTKDAFAGQTFDYLLANPPFGVDWSKVEGPIRQEHEQKGFDGRFGPGLPRKSDGQLLFLLHMMAKMRPAAKGGSRIAIVFNGSPLFSGAAGSGESEIRRWIIENDLLEAVIGLPDQLFYNTGISTYIWVVTNRKHPRRAGHVQLIDAREQFVKMRKSLGDKRKEISPEQLDEITRLYGDYEEGPNVRILPNEAFGFSRITVERPLRLVWRGGPDAAAAFEGEKAFRDLVTGKGADPKVGATLQQQLTAAVTAVLHEPALDRKTAEKQLKNKLGTTWADLKAPVKKALLAALSVRRDDAPPVPGKGDSFEPDVDLRDNENVPLAEDIEDYFASHFFPFVPDAWIDYSKTRVGFEIPFSRYFYTYTQNRLLPGIDTEIQGVSSRIAAQLQALTDRRHNSGTSLRSAEPVFSLRRLSHLARLGTGHTPDRSKPEYWEDCTIPWVTAADLSSRESPYDPLMDTAQHISELGVANSAAVIHPAGTVMLCRTASVGLVCRIGVPMATTQAFVTWTPGPDLDSEYLMFCLVAMREEWDRLKFGSTHETIYFPDVQSISIPHCSLENQREVVRRIRNELASIEALTLELRNLHSLLSERNQSLLRTVLFAPLISEV